jgi:hypothetical protein
MSSRRSTPTQDRTGSLPARETIAANIDIVANIDELSPLIGKVEVSGANLNGPNAGK